MSKTNTRIFILAIVTFLSVVSCKKKSQSIHDNFVGNWKMHQITIDMNNNNAQDASDQSVTIDSLFLKLNSDGSGSFSSSTVSPQPLSWALANNDNDLQVTQAGTVSIMPITTKPGSTFVVRGTTGSPTGTGSVAIWETFTKM
jgi:hypothetical protein